MKSFGQICIPLNSSIAPVLEKDPNHGRLCVIMKQVCVTMKHRCVTQVEKSRGCARVLPSPRLVRSTMWQISNTILRKLYLHVVPVEI